MEQKETLVLNGKGLVEFLRECIVDIPDLENFARNSYLYEETLGYFLRHNEVICRNHPMLEGKKKIVINFKETGNISRQEVEGRMMYSVERNDDITLRLFRTEKGNN